jgi:hypothetical protein
MIDAATILSETTLSLDQAAKRLPPGRNGAPVSLACVLRWVLRGARGPDHETPGGHVFEVTEEDLRRGVLGLLASAVDNAPPAQAPQPESDDGFGLLT